MIYNTNNELDRINNDDHDELLHLLTYVLLICATIYMHIQ